MCYSYQVVLVHKNECEVPKIAEQKERENLIAIPQLEREWETRIGEWTLGGVRVTSMNRLIELGISPLKLGPQGRRKVRNLLALCLLGRRVCGWTTES